MVVRGNPLDWLAEPEPHSRSSTVGTDGSSSSIWEPKTFGIIVPNAPLSSAGQDLVNRNAAWKESPARAPSKMVCRRPQ
jgi:hypothetical protein